MSITEGQLMNLAMKHKEECEDLNVNEKRALQCIKDQINELRERMENLERPMKIKAEDDDGEALERVIRTLKREYARAKTLEYVVNPIAWALYHTWRVEDNRNDGRRKKKYD